MQTINLLILLRDKKYEQKTKLLEYCSAESFFKSLKTELIYGNKLITKEQMKIQIFEHIKIWYNKKRQHSA